MKRNIFLNLYKLLFSYVCICWLSSEVLAQTPALYAKHYIYEQFINPAATGRDISPVVNLAHKMYWQNTSASPAVTCLGASMRMGSFGFYNPQKMLNKTGVLSKGRMGLGALLIADKDGALTSNSLTLTYAYFIPLEERKREFSFGLSLHLMEYTVNNGMLKPLQTGDTRLSTLNQHRFVPESGCGVLYHDLQFYAGFSVNDLLLSQTTLNQDNTVKNTRDYFFNAGYKIFLHWFELEPGIFLAQINQQPFYYYGQLKMYYLNYNWVSLGYKSTQSMMLTFGFNIHRFYVAYAYEQSVGQMHKSFDSSNEFMLGINIGLYEPEGLRRKGKNKLR